MPRHIDPIDDILDPYAKCTLFTFQNGNSRLKTTKPPYPHGLYILPCNSLLHAPSGFFGFLRFTGARVISPIMLIDEGTTPGSETLGSWTSIPPAFIIGWLTAVTPPCPSLVIVIPAVVAGS